MWQHVYQNQRYLISDDGRVFDTATFKLLAQSKNAGGYPIVSLVQAGAKSSIERKTDSVHRIMAFTFLGPPALKLGVDDQCAERASR